MKSKKFHAKFLALIQKKQEPFLEGGLFLVKMPRKNLLLTAKKTLAVFVNVVTIFTMTFGPAFAAAPTVTNVSVTDNEITVTFDQATLNISNPNSIDETGVSTNYANDLRNYLLESPTGTSIPLSRMAPINLSSQSSSSDTVTTITGLSLPAGQSCRFTIQNIGNATTTPEIMATPSVTTGTVQASAGPRLDNITPMYGKYAQGGLNITLTGANFPTATSTTEIVCTWGSSSKSLTVVSASATSTVATIGTDDLGSADGNPRYCTIRNTTAGVGSKNRNFYLYDTVGYGVLYGTIKDSDGSTAVDRVALQAYVSGSNWMRYNGQSQKNGAFAIVVPAGTYTIETATPGSGSTGAAPAKTTGKIVTAGNATNAGTVTFTTALVSGKIYAPNGTTPIYGAEIRAHNMDWSVEKVATSGLDGSYKLYLTPSTTASLYTIEVNPGDYYKNVLGYLDTSASVNVPNTTPQTQNISLSTLNVTGTVKTPTGSATASNPYPNELVPRANVHIMGSGFDRWSQTDDSGAFKFGGVPNGTYTIEIEPPFCGDSDPDVAKLCVYARTRIDNQTVANNTGNFNVRFSAPNFFGYVYADADSDNEVDAGEGIANTWVQLDRDGFFTGSPTDSNGRYAFYLPNTGSYHLNVYPPSSSGYANSMSDITVSTLPLTSAYNVKLTTPNVSGFIYGPTGTTGQSGGWVSLCPAEGPGNCYGSGPDSNGAFNVSVSDGSWTLRLDPNWGSEYVAPAAKTVVVANGTVSTVDGDTNDSDEPFNNNNKIIVRMVDPANDPTGFTGYVYGPLGSADATTGQSNIGIGMRPAVAEGTSCRGEGMSSWTQTNSQGKFSLSGISAGLYEIEAIPWSGGSYSRVRICHTVTSSSSTRTKNINLTSPNITGTIATPTGSVSSENPEPDTAVANVWVSLFAEGPMGPGGGSYGGNANENGIFGLGGVPPGTYTLEVNPNWGSVYSSKRYQGITLTDEDSDGIADTTNLNEVIGTASTNFPNKAIRIGTPNLKGKIVDPDGTAVQNVWVMVHDENWMYNNGGNTDSGGFFRIGGLSDGTYTIEVNMPWGGSQALVAPSGLTVEIASNVGTIKQNGTPLANNTITLTVPQKTITGTVTKSSVAVSNAIVAANRDRGGGYFETRTNSSGQYTLKVSGGSWWVDVRPTYDGTQPDWVYNEPPAQVTFAENNATESKTADFSVAAADATITGVVKTPTNSAVQNVWVEVRGNKGMGNGNQTDNNGRFSVRVPAGTYFVNVFTNSPDYGSPDQKSVAVTSQQTTDAGTLYLKAKNSHIKGLVQDDAGNPLQNIVINAHLINSPGWTSTFTDQTGAYDLSVWSGQWNVMVMPMSQNYVYQGAPKNITVTSSETSENNNFQLKNANKTIKVKVKKYGTGDMVNDIWGGVWVRDTSAGMLDFGGPMDDMMEKSGMMTGGEMSGGTAGSGTAMGVGEKGGFMGGGLNNGYTEVKVPSGTFEIGLGMPPGSKYTLDATQTVTVEDTDTTKEIVLYVRQNNATVSGTFYLDVNDNDSYDEGTDTVVTGIRAFVHADRDGGGWQMVESNTNGTYTLQVAAGTWFMNAFIDPMMNFGSNRYLVINEGTQISILDNGTATKNFKVKKLDATITGTVKNPDGSAMTGTGYGLVWVFADFGSKDMVDEFKGPGGPGLGTFTEADGTYSLKVPAGTYKIGAGVPPWDTRDLLNPELITVTVAADETSTGNNLQFKQSDATISGQITLNSVKQAAYVKAWSDAGSGAGTVSTDGTYTLNVMQGDTWHVTASAEISNAYYESEEVDIEIAAGTATTTQDLVLVSKNLVIPEGVSSTFDASQSKTLKVTKTVGGVVQDEVVMEIPAGAIATSGSITVSITPTVNTKPDSKDKPVGVAYNFEALDSNGNKIESFNQDITIYLSYDPEFIAAAGYSEDSITPKYFDTTTGSWENYPNVVRDTENNRMIIKTNHFSTGGFTGSGSIPNAPSGLTATAQSSSSIALSWTDNSSDEDAFKIYRGGTLVHTTSASATSYTDTGLAANTTYTYYVKASNTSGDSTASSSASATTYSTGGSGGTTSVSGGSIVTKETTKAGALEKPITEMTKTEIIAKIAEIQAAIVALQKQLLELTGGLSISGIPTGYKFQTTLKFGVRSDDVKYLQMFLKAQGTNIYPEGLVTGYYGSMTTAAVTRFQEKYADEILTPLGLNAGTGITGQNTLAKINTLMGM